MKRANFVKLGVLLIFLFLVSIIPLVAEAQEDTTIVTDTLYSIPEIDGVIWYSEYYSNLFVVTSSKGYVAGDGWDVIVGGENYDRSFLSIDLSPLLDSIIVIEATLNLYQFRSSGNNTLGVFPIWDVPGGDTLNCIMDHIDYGAYLDTSDWGAGDPGHPKTLTSNIGVLSDNATIEYKTMDVTRYVQADIDAKRKRSQFRVRFPIDTDHDSSNDCLDFKSSSTSTIFKPYMLIRYKRHNAVEEWGDHSFPGEFRLEQNFPNPVNENTVIRYSLLVDRSVISLKIYNILGKEVKTLVNGRQRSGHYSVTWEGKDKEGREVGSGIYFCRLEVKGEKLKVTKARKLLLLR